MGEIRDRVLEGERMRGEAQSVSNIGDARVETSIVGRTADVGGHPLGHGLGQAPSAHNKLHSSTFEYLAPTPKQKQDMQLVRNAAASYEQILEIVVPDGPDKTYLLRKLREVGMWANVAITRYADGTPRT